MDEFMYVVGSNSVDLRSSSIVDRWSKVYRNCIFPDKEETRLGMAFETSMRNIDNCELVLAIPKDDGTFGESTTWEIAYALHNRKRVIIGHPNGSSITIFNISQLKNVKV